MKVKTNRGGNKETKCDTDRTNLNRRSERNSGDSVLKKDGPSQYHGTLNIASRNPQTREVYTLTAHSSNLGLLSGTEIFFMNLSIVIKPEQ